MPNSDNTHGTYNKRTVIWKQEFPAGDGSTTKQEFSSVSQAQSAILTTAQLAVYNECCTTLQWALVKDQHDPAKTTALKATFDFGTKGASDQAEADDWAKQFEARKTALTDVPAFPITMEIITASDSAEHLF